jgi:hypothetical protein
MKRAIIPIVFIVIFLLIPLARAGQGVLLPNTVDNMSYSASFSYPDTLRHEGNYSVSMSMMVLFNNASITNINITQIDILVVPENVNPNATYHEVEKYFIGEQWTYDRSIPLYTLHRANLGETVVANFNDTRLFELGYNFNETIAKIYVEIQFRVQTGTTQYSWYPLVYYADVGEMPRVQLLPSTSPQGDNPLFLDPRIILVILIIVVGCILVLLAFRFRGKREHQ